MIEYINGGYKVEIDETTGTKIRTQLSNLPPVQPETFDLKVTDWCNAGCAFCHENSTKQGKHADLDALLKITDGLLPGTEIAIGGGHPLAWPHLDSFLEESKKRGYFCNITVNGIHIPKSLVRLAVLQANDLIKGIGVSAITNHITTRAFNLHEHSLQNIVGHIILGRFDGKYYGHEQLLPHYLVLGYKEFGRGLDYHKNYNTDVFQQKVFNLMQLAKKHNFKLSFDNLALEQAKVKQLVPEDVWDAHYMGEDGKFSMYIDAVEQKFAKTSTAPYNQRRFWDISLKEYFQSLQPASPPIPKLPTPNLPTHNYDDIWMDGGRMYGYGYPRSGAGARNWEPGD